MQRLLLSAAVVALLVSGRPAHAQLFGGGGDGLLEEIGDMFDEVIKDFGDFTNLGGTIESRAELDTMRTTAEGLAEQLGPLPALAMFQMLQYGEARIQSELQWRMVESKMIDHSPLAQGTAAEVRDELGTQGIAWAPEAALDQHHEAYLERMGSEVKVQTNVRDRLSQMISQESAANEELVTILGEQQAMQVEDMATMRAMVDDAMAAEGQTEVLQKVAQLNALVITKLSQMQAVSSAFYKVMATDRASEEFERGIAFEQRFFDTADKPITQFGIPDMQALGGGGVSAAAPTPPANPGDGPFVGPGV